MSVICGRPCPFSNGIYCNKDIVIMTPFGQCDEWWGKRGEPLPQIRDLSGLYAKRENNVNDLEKVLEKIEENIEKCEEDTIKKDLNAEIDNGEMSSDIEKGAETQDET